MEPIPPIVVEEHGDLDVFESVVEAEEYLEPVDVENEEYRFYDSTGLVLRGEVETEGTVGGRLRQLLRPPRERVRIVAPAAAERRTDELAEMLREYLSGVDLDRIGLEERNLTSMTLDQLVSVTAAFQRSRSW